ncbi:unnamed protein product [Pocillopora meandrina]|uniref:Uncharacterized protein n=1 Tax=Pocillopora meandrina TaxID=46732 RepID=A0AAU9WVP1_9CNID|nr:unnamed protein product [Pocillopora meandrina]
MFVMFHPGQTVDRGFEAKYKSIPTGGVDPCSEYPCANDSTCVDNEDSTFKCICPPGVTGDRCQVGLDPCSEYPCANNGTCVDNGNNTFKCICPPGVTGDRCQVDIDECRENKDHCQDICENTMGSYYCSCSDPELSVARDKRHCIAEGVEVDCGQDEITITLPKSLLLGLDREHLRLIDANCTATENETHFFLHTETGKCGTISKHNKDYVIYSNMVSEIPIEENKIVTRLRQAMIPFDCFYSNWGVASSIGIRPSDSLLPSLRMTSLLNSQSVNECTLKPVSTARTQHCQS